ncbi:MAG: ABC transporter permease subunit [Candidatus Caldarchaeum sp.]
MESKNVLIIARKEVRDFLRNRWFILYTLGFSLLAVLLLYFTTSGGEFIESKGFGRTAASLVNLVLFFIPLISLVTGSISISSERETGTLAYLLSHPVTKSEIFAGKFMGLLASISVSIVLGFGLSGMVISFKVGYENLLSFLMTAFLSLLLAASLLGIGFLISAFSRNASRAIGLAVFLWLALIILGDLGIMGTSVVLDLGIRELFVLALINPAQVFKVASIVELSKRFEVLGPVGVYVLRTFGSFGAKALLILVLTAWAIAPLSFAFYSFTRLKKEV